MWAIYHAPHISLSLLCLIRLEPNTNNTTKGNCTAAIWTPLRRFHFHLSSIPPSAAFNYAKRNTNLTQTSGGNTACCLTHSFVNAEGVLAQTGLVYNYGGGTAPTQRKYSILNYEELTFTVLDIGIISSSQKLLIKDPDLISQT